MASREFLKILQSARMGDVSAQQNLALAYLNGAFKTPIQPANALIWLERSYSTLQNQLLSSLTSSNGEISLADTSAPKILEIFQQISTVPLEATFHSPAFSFGWDLFWKIAELNLESSIAVRTEDLVIQKRWRHRFDLITKDR